MSDPVDAPASDPTLAKANDPKPTRYLPTDRIAFKKQLEVVRALAIASGPAGKAVSVKEVADMLSMSPMTIQLAIPFLAENGILQRTEAGMIPSQDVIAFQRAHEWNSESAPTKLRPLLAASWFGQAIVQRLSFRTLEKAEAIQILAEACGAAKRYQPQLEILLDYLRVGGLIEWEGDQLKASKSSTSAPPQESERTTVDPTPAQATPRATVTTTFAQPTEGVVQFHVSVKVDMAEFSGWRPERIAAFFGGIAQVLAAKSAIEKGVAE